MLRFEELIADTSVAMLFLSVCFKFRAMSISIVFFCIIAAFLSLTYSFVIALLGRATNHLLLTIASIGALLNNSLVRSLKDWHGVQVPALKSLFTKHM